MVIETDRSDEDFLKLCVRIWFLEYDDIGKNKKPSDFSKNNNFLTTYHDHARFFIDGVYTNIEYYNLYSALEYTYKYNPCTYTYVQLVL